MNSEIRRISEADWRVLRDVKSAALERFCQQTLDQVVEITREHSLPFYERYLRVFSLLNDRDMAMSRIFDEISRSNAYFALASLRSSDLLTETEFSRFSDETQHLVEVLLS